MTNIGDFSSDVKDITTIETFGWFGEDIRINPHFSELDLIDMAEEIAALSEEDQSMKQITFLKDQFRILVHDGDFDKFWRLAKENRCGIEYLANVQRKVIEYVAKRPTLLSSVSSDGRTVIEATSEEKREATVSPLTAMDIRYAERELQGRPDLRLALLEQAEHRAG